MSVLRRLSSSSSSLSLPRIPTDLTTTQRRAGHSYLLSVQHQPALFLSLNLHHHQSKLRSRRRTRNLHCALIKAIEDGNEENPTTNNQSSSTTSSTDGESNDEEEKKTLETVSSGGVDELGAEIKETMKKIKERESEDDKVGGGGDFWSGVAEEIKEIEWPVFGKVLGITGVVLGVIAGSSVVLLTVNAVLAELSDQAFAGKGVQDFFG